MSSPTRLVSFLAVLPDAANGGGCQCVAASFLLRQFPNQKGESLLVVTLEDDGVNSLPVDKGTASAENEAATL
jgi:hypothetical protein